MVGMGLQTKKASSWCCTDDSGPTRSKLGKKGPIHSADGEDSDMADRTEKRPRKISALQKLEVNRISTKLIYTETFSIYWKIIGRPVSQEPALSPINMIKTLACLNLCMSLKHVLKKENSLTSVFNLIWILLVRCKEFYTRSYKKPLCSRREPCQPYLLLPLRNPAKKQQLKNLVTVFKAAELH